MRKNLLLLLPLAALTAAVGFSQSGKRPEPAARRIEVLFLGAPLENSPAHDPIERYRLIKKELGADGINFSYTEDLADINRSVLDQYDAVLMYANWDQGGTLHPDREKALISYVEDGGAFLPIHCASACFGASDNFIKLVGARFQSHGAEVFRTKIVAPEHPIMRGYEGFETWDETYVHDRHGDDRTILQLREEEPWTWVREQGKGRVFYTAYGHDMRCWDQAGFHELLRRAILWSVGGEVRAQLTNLKLPELQMEDMVLPGYKQRRTITRGQSPLPAAESLKFAQVPVGFELSLFASDPEIVNPIHIAWDHRGRAFVVETVDYPNNLHAGNLGNDRIKICEDTNGDGKADKFTVFADKLSIPTSIVFANGGLITTNGSQMLFLKDADGDDKADVREVLFEGFGMGDTHAGPSNLRYGFDNWIYATVGYSGFDGTVGGTAHKFSSGTFRFRPDGSALEYLQATTNNTWGLGFTNDFDITGSTANGNPSWYLTFPQAHYTAAGLQQPRTPAADNNPKFFPSSMDIRQVDVHDGFSAAAGHSFYTSERFPEKYRDRVAFVCEPTGKLVASFGFTRKGAGFVARQLPNNLYSSADGWSGPVQAETGPDGAVWIADWYNIIIQHNPTPNKASAGFDATNGRGNAYETPHRDVRHGRIYRVFPKGTTDDPNPALDPANPGTLIAALGHSNQFWRLHAQRLLVETRPAAIIPALRREVASGAPAGKSSALHAFHALQGMGALDLPTITAGLSSENRGLRRAAIANAPLDATLPEMAAKDGIFQAADDRELAEIFVALTRLAPSEPIGNVLYKTLQTRKDDILGDPTLADAWQIAARHHAAGVLLAAAEDPTAQAVQAPVNLLVNPGFSDGATGWTLRAYNVARPDAVEITTTPDGRNGPSLRIKSDIRADVGAGADVKVKPNTRYRLGGWVRTEGLKNHGGRGAMLNVHTTEGNTKAISGDTEWTELSTEFSSGNRDSILVHCLFGGYGGSNGTALFDDLYLHEIGGGDITAPIQAVASHFAAKGEPAARTAVIQKLTASTSPGAKPLLATLGTPPGVEKTIVRTHAPDPAVHARGREVYQRTCVACHGPDGKGVAGAFPPLDGVDWATGDPTVPIRIVLHGLHGPIQVLGRKYENIMPPHTDLKDQEIADVLTYVRQSWKNDAAPVNPAQVKSTRETHQTRTTPWTAAELR
ncbi:ThuA domain-containing protein [Akkermansiaceae bacterium]|nr:ThuA domain-containing protein [Akkermansiaceae bacterium]